MYKNLQFTYQFFSKVPHPLDFAKVSPIVAFETKMFSNG